jgi:hypothetical protein
VSSARKSDTLRSAILRNTGRMRPPSVSKAMPRSTHEIRRRSPARESYEALSAGSALQAAAMARASHIVTSSPGGQSSMSAASVTVAGATRPASFAIVFSRPQWPVHRVYTARAEQ